ncbi:unnamed protein product [Rhizoctonia solani]|uniref:Uncharacterized protein n=1 Tax=Rhizoctonia solani TaxID=456999 RepID=A0A8H2WKB4_9AGAM|nr:unnamed protein product [Rhizoctonia solani]
MPHNHLFASAHITSSFTFDGANLLYANFPRTDAKELRYLLVRGSGYVVRGGHMPKSWFQAQCAHYGLPTRGTLAALRNQLELFLANPLPQVPKGLIVLEKQKRDAYASVLTSVSSQQNTLANQPKDEPEQTEERISPETLVKAGETQRDIPIQTTSPLADKTRPCSSPIATTEPPKKLSLPWAKIAAVARFKKSVRWDPVLAENAFQEIKLRMGRPKPTSDTDTDSEVEDDPFTSNNFQPLAPPLSRRSFASRVPRNIVPFTADVVSGQWDLCVTGHNVSPLPAPWKNVSSKWLKGDMNVQLSGDGRSLTGEFALLGLDGKFKSRKSELRDDGISTWIGFVAQMPIATTKPIRYQGHKEHKLTFGPSETQYGYLRFYGSNRVRGMLRCRKYGRLEFDGIRKCGPVDMVLDWKSFVE